MAMLTIALSKGRVFDETLPLLAAAGIAPAEDPETSRKLIIDSNRPDVRFIIVRASDVPHLRPAWRRRPGRLRQGRASGARRGGLYQPVDLGIGRCRMVVAAKTGFDYEGALRRGARLSVATKYVMTAREHFAAKGMHVDLIKLYGSMELRAAGRACRCHRRSRQQRQDAQGQWSGRGGRNHGDQRAPDRQSGGAQAQARQRPAGARRPRPKRAERTRHRGRCQHRQSTQQRLKR